MGPWKDDVVEGQANPLSDRLASMFTQQADFMDLLHRYRDFPEWPVDLTSKQGQQACREAALGGIEEWFEALKHLKNWKKHRASEVREVDRAEFLEEMCDALHYFVEVALLADVTPEELFEAYWKKGETNKRRIAEGY